MDNNNPNQTIYETNESYAKKRPKKIIIIRLILTVVAVIIIFLFLNRAKTPNSSNKNQDNSGNLAAETNTKSVDQAENQEVSEETQKLLDSFVGDQDRDGISAEDEKKFGTSDSDFDTDWDGLSDKAEIEQFGTDPIKSDTDGDGYADGFEITNGFNPKGPGKL